MSAVAEPDLDDVVEADDVGPGDLADALASADEEEVPVAAFDGTISARVGLEDDEDVPDADAAGERDRTADCEAVTLCGGLLEDDTVAETVARDDAVTVPEEDGKANDDASGDNDGRDDGVGSDDFVAEGEGGACEDEADCVADGIAEKEGRALRDGAGEEDVATDDEAVFVGSGVGLLDADDDGDRCAVGVGV